MAELTTRDVAVGGRPPQGAARRVGAGVRLYPSLDLAQNAKEPLSALSRTTATVVELGLDLQGGVAFRFDGRPL